MKIVKIENRKILNSFLGSEKYTQFLQSFEWGEFQESNGNNIFRIGVEENGDLLAVATLIKKSLGFGKSYFYCPRGPIFDEFRISNFKFQMEEVVDFLFAEIKNISKENGVIFLRYEPLENHKLQITNHKSIDLQPKKTLMINLSLPEEEALKMMHQKTRYNIRLAKKKGVEIVEGELEGFDDFWKLMNTTSRRDDFRIHSKTHYKKLLEIDFVKLYFAKFENNIIAAGLFSFFGDTATYMHGASSNEYRNLMSPFLLQWEVAKLAKKENFKYYDFYGIDEKKWPGVTRFKKGFGGFEVNYPGTLDLAFNEMWYNGYKFLRKVRRMF